MTVCTVGQWRVDDGEVEGNVQIHYQRLALLDLVHGSRGGGAGSDILSLVVLVVEGEILRQKGFKIKSTPKQTTTKVPLG